MQGSSGNLVALGALSESFCAPLLVGVRQWVVAHAFLLDLVFAAETLRSAILRATTVMGQTSAGHWEPPSVVPLFVIYSITYYILFVNTYM